ETRAEHAAAGAEADGRTGADWSREAGRLRVVLGERNRRLQGPRVLIDEHLAQKETEPGIVERGQHAVNVLLIDDHDNSNWNTPELFGAVGWTVDITEGP